MTATFKVTPIRELRISADISAPEELLKQQLLDHLSVNDIYDHIIWKTNEYYDLTTNRELRCVDMILCKKIEDSYG